jgi:hypothetical protein
MTTAVARMLTLQRIEAIERSAHCRRRAEHDRIPLDRARAMLAQVSFYNAAGPEGGLRFSQVVGRPASPDLTLRELAGDVAADAFVLGYQDGERYVRTRAVVLAAGYFAQPDPHSGARRPTTEDEKQALLLHELLHIVLDKDDDELDRRELCPLRLLAFCPRAAAAGTQGEVNQ